MHNQKFIIIFFICLLTATIMTFTVSAEEKDVKTIYSQYLRLCEEYYLPNSMARQKGFDINKRLKQIEKEKDKAAMQLQSAEGLKYVKSIMASTTDDLEKQCAADVLSVSKKKRK